jgi:O-antigen/teichoic acid export membrane protein
MIKQVLQSKNMRNSFWNVSEVLVAPFILFISIPFFLRYLGSADYGIWMLVNTLIVLLQSLNLGLNTSTYKHVSHALAENNEKQITQTLNTNISLTILISLFGCLLLLVFLAGVFFFNWFVDQPDEKITLATSVLLGGFLLFSKLTEQILYNVYRAYESFQYVTILSISSKLVSVVGSIGIAYYSRNVALVLAFNAVIAVLFLPVSLYYLKRFIPFYHFRFTLQKTAIRHEVNYSMFVWMQTIVVVATYQGDRLLVSYGFGLDTLSFYTIVATIFNHIHMAFAALTGWVFPQIAKNIHDTAFVLRFYLHARNLSAFLAISILTIFALLSEPLFTIWLGTEHFLQIEAYLKLFTMFEFVFLFTIVPNFLLNGFGYEKLNWKLTLVYTLLNCIGMYGGYVFFQTVESILIGLVVTTIMGMFILHITLDHKFQLSKNSVVSTLVLFVPSLLGISSIYFTDWSLKIVLSLATIVSAYLLFIHVPKTKFNLLVQ